MSAIDHDALEIERLNYLIANTQLNNAISLLRTAGCLSFEESEKMSLRVTAHLETAKKIGAYKPRKESFYDNAK